MSCVFVIRTMCMTNRRLYVPFSLDIRTIAISHYEKIDVKNQLLSFIQNILQKYPICGIKKVINLVWIICLSSFKLLGQSVLELSVAQGVGDQHDLRPWPLTY